MSGFAPALDGLSTAAKRILIIEDDPVVRFNLASYLEDSGYEIQEVEDGDLGLAVAREMPPDLVLCDLRMPRMDGISVLRRLHKEVPELPVIVVSGTGVLSDAVEALREGAWDFVVKPIQDMAVLEHAIEGALEKARLIRQNNRYQQELEQANRLLREQLARIEEDADAGRRIQLQLMPPDAQQFGPYRFSRYLLASMYLSGDFVDYFVIDADHLGFFLADVSGHGVSSAFVTVLLKSFVQRSLERLHQDGERAVLHPHEALLVLNESMCRQGLEKYLTIFYGVIERDSGRLAYANGGHFPPPILRDASGARFIAGRGMPVGLFEAPSFESAQIELAPGASLTLCSDGVLETLLGGSLDDRLRRLLQMVDGPVASVGDLATTVGLDLAREYPDDITILRLEREEAK